MEVERRGELGELGRKSLHNWKQEDVSKNMTKVYQIDKKMIYQAWLQVRQNGGSAGCDKMSLTVVEKDYKDYLYKLWNRMSSGSYMASPVRKVCIPKAKGKERTLGIPTVLDRIAQTAAKMTIETKLESEFHSDSYGYRPNRSAHDALDKARKRCWDNAWVIDLDIQNFFDTISHDKMLEIVDRRIEERWVKLYIKRWLKANLQDEDGKEIKRIKGTPQGGVISPLLANLYLDEAFDWWITKAYPQVKFERYADDIIIHCRTLEQAEDLLKAVKERLAFYDLVVHPEKTKIVYCKQEERKGRFAYQKFTFLGYDFQPREVKKSNGKLTVGFIPAVGTQSSQRIRQTVRSWKWNVRGDHSIQELASFANPVIRGWLTYYGRYAGYILRKVLKYIDDRLLKWIKRKYKIRGIKRALKKLDCEKQTNPALFAHWKF